MDLQNYMNGAIRRIMSKAYLNVLGNPREAKTILRLQNTFLKSEKRRSAVARESGLDVPPFLICSISTECNLSCKGCYALVTSDEYVDRLRDMGCKLIIYVEYVPTEKGTEHLAFGEQDLEMMEAVQDHQRERYKDIIIISFPGDEKHLGGCLAAGRGFFHIGPDGSAEPCPFSPYSDCNVTATGLKGALQSPLFRQLRNLHLVGGEHSGGCALWEHRQEVEQLLSKQ